MSKPICYDLFCGLGGWSEAFIAEGYDCIGFDVEAHNYGTGGYPGKLILRDVRSIHGSELKDAAAIVASPPCQAYSYRAMPWRRAKALPPPDNTLFNEYFRIQREAIEAAGHFIPLIVENVRGAQKWVGRARWNYGSFYLWGDVPALMPHTFKGLKVGDAGARTFQERRQLAAEHPENDPTNFWHGSLSGRKVSMNFHEREEMGVKQSGISGTRENGKGDRWFQDGAAQHGSKSNARKAASAMIAKIPYPLAAHIARCYKPKPMEVCA